MKNYWKQFAAWVTALRDDPFTGSQLNLTLASFFFSIIVLLLGGHPVLAIILPLLNYLLANTILNHIRTIIRTQKRFIADASHELRTPLSIIKADSELALREGTNLATADALNTITSTLEEVNRMSKIIENLLALSFYDAKVTEIPFAPVQLADLAANLVRKAQIIAAKKGVNLAMAETEPVVILGNTTALEQMIMNLIRNALLYTPSGGSVRVRVLKSSEDMAVLKVTDTGVGVSEKDLPNIFNPFYKAEHPGRTEGSGLGLTIVKKIVERHHGRIRLESELGKGTTVTAEFALQAPMAEQSSSS